MTHTERLRTDLASRLYELVTYGPKYLDRDELERAIDAHMRFYFILGREAVHRRDSEFWALHRAKLASLGYRLSRRRVAAGAIRYLLELGPNPWSTVRQLARHRELGS